jgi:hypothetical protein
MPLDDALAAMPGVIMGIPPVKKLPEKCGSNSPPL